MPIYLYKCSFCEHEEEQVRCMDDRNKGADCPKCGGPLVRENTTTQVNVKNPAVPRRTK